MLTPLGPAPPHWANARLRALASDTIDGGLWRLLWMPASLPYHEPGGPYASVSGEVTKRLIFSSWVAAPSPIASLLSYEVERRIFEGAGLDENTPTVGMLHLLLLACSLQHDLDMRLGAAVWGCRCHGDGRVFPVREDYLVTT